MEVVARLVRTSEITLRNLFRWPWQSTSLFPSRGLEPSYAGLCPSFEPAEHVEEDKKSEGFLWGVPKRRRTVEVRMSRKIGASNWHWKMLRPKTTLRICDTCGHHYEAKHLCRNCYERVKTETEAIREAVEKQQGDDPENKGVVVLYANELSNVDPSVTKNKIIVEMEKPRPAWFGRNLLQKSTVGPDGTSTTVTVRPPNLG